MTTRRHLLVVASQCARMAPLPLLERAVRNLCGVLEDPELGACVPGLPDGRSRSAGPLVEDVRAEIRVAVEYAATHRAMLVLVLLGHGFVPGKTNDLHMMVADSREGDPFGSVSVSTVFRDAANRLGLNGVIGIVDTCSAAGAIPEIGGLLQGNAGGRARVAMLMAAAVQQSAVEFRLADGLARLLRDGVLGGGRFLDVHTMHNELTRAPSGSRIVKFDYDGAVLGSPLWLGLNRRHAAATVGTPGRTALADALAKLTPSHAGPPEWTDAALRDLQKELADVPQTPGTAWTLRILDSLRVAMRTTDLLHEVVPEALDTPSLRRAMAAAGVSFPGAAKSAATDVAELVERISLWYPVSDETCREQVARFVMALVGDSATPFDLPEITKWAKAIKATIQVNDAARWAGQLTEEKRLRLIVSLHASTTGDWPETVETWLLLDGRLDDDGHHRIPCTSDKPGVEAAVVDAVDAAEQRADLLRLRLDRIDVAVPTKLLLEWQPEKVVRGEWIGTDFTVVMRWSERLHPTKEVQRLHRSATRRLQYIDTHVGGAPVDWLDHTDTHNLRTLSDKLVRGNYDGAVALDRHPPHGERLFSLLLAHVPIVFWPQPTCEHPLAEHDCLDVCWDRMPDELIVAYRREWRDERTAATDASAATDAVAQLRAVWDDKEWLDFCQAYRRGTSG